MERHIFISYSHRDKPLMQKVNDHLNRQGLETWVDSKGLRPGTPSWWKAIENGIKNAYAFVVLLTPDANQSKVVGDEITFAQLHEIDIYPILAKGADKDSLPLNLVSAQYVDIREHFEQPMRDLVKELLNALNQPVDEPTVAPAEEPTADREWVSITVGERVGTTLGEIVRFHVPRQLPRVNSPEGNYPYYGHNGIIRYVSTYEYDGTYLAVTRVAPNVSADAQFSAYVVEGKFSASQGLFLLEVVEDIPVEFLRAFIEHQPLAPFIHGGGFQRYISGSKFAQLKILLPSYQEMKQINEQFTEITRVRYLMRYQLELIEELETELKRRMFSAEDEYDK